MVVEDIFAVDDPSGSRDFASSSPTNTRIMESSHPRIGSFIISVLPTSTKRALNLLSSQRWLNKTKWYLAGGTALAMNVGHRRSVDLDFFTPQATFSTTVLIKHFDELEWEIDIVREGTVYGRLSGAKVSFIAYPFFLPKEPMWKYGAVRVLSPKDVAVMKVIAVSQRGRKRDFVDLFWYATHYEPLVDVLRRLPAQYPTVAHDYHHILKSQSIPIHE